MNIPKNNEESFERLKTKKCKRPGCTNLIMNHKNKEYCQNPRCVAFRDMQKYGEKGKSSHIPVYPKTINIIIPKKKKLSGKVIKIRCSAVSPNGRCDEVTHITYKANRSRYPKYCEKHRNEYQRKRFEEGHI